MCSIFRKWKEEKAALLEEMDEKEKQDQEDWIAQGKKELEEWYARLNEQLGKTKENNRYIKLNSAMTGIVKPCTYKTQKGRGPCTYNNRGCTLAM